MAIFTGGLLPGLMTGQASCRRAAGARQGAGSLAPATLIHEGRPLTRAHQEAKCLCSAISSPMRAANRNAVSGIQQASASENADPQKYSCFASVLSAIRSAFATSGVAF